MKQKTCCFMESSYFPYDELFEIQEEIERKIIKLIQKGICMFVSRGKMGFDILAVETVLSLKYKYPHVKVKIVFSSPNQMNRTINQDYQRYRYILKYVDEVCFLSKRNCKAEKSYIRYMISNAHYCLTYF